VLEAEVIHECFKTAFKPGLDAIERTLESPKRTLVFLYGGSTCHEFFRREVTSIVRKHSTLTTELIGHDDGRRLEKIDKGSVSYQINARRKTHLEKDSTSSSKR
jgi:hypothetical protein